MNLKIPEYSEITGDFRTQEPFSSHQYLFSSGYLVNEDNTSGNATLSYRTWKIVIQVKFIFGSKSHQYRFINTYFVSPSLLRHPCLSYPDFESHISLMHIIILIFIHISTHITYLVSIYSMSSVILMLNI